MVKRLSASKIKERFVATSFKNVYQFKITLKGSKPPIWRRIQVPENYSFWDLHAAIIDVMGWSGFHLHSFTIEDGSTPYGLEIGLPEESEYLHGTKIKIKKYFKKEKDKASYTYDFGDNWEHRIVLEKILPKDPQKKYPLCLAGKMACPPEDCGSLWGYYDKLRILADPGDNEYEDILEWMGEDFDPLHFDPSEVVFQDPKMHLEMMETMIEFSGL